MLEPAAHSEVAEPSPMLGGAVRKLGRLFQEAGLPSPTLDARILVAEACGCDPCGLILDRDAAVSATQAARIASFAARRLAGEPVSRILGRREFWGLSFRISPATLDPRPESELLVEIALDHIRAQEQGPPHPSPLPRGEREQGVPVEKAFPSPLAGEGTGVRGAFSNHQEPLRILDLGTGSGCILAALLLELPHALGIGIDRSEAALAVAQDNLTRVGLRDRASFLCANWMSAIGGAFDVIVCNPPYIAPSEIRLLEPEVRAYDPYPALDGGEDGLDAYRTVIPQALAALSKGGLLVFEVGCRQSEAVLNLMKLLAPDPALSGLRIVLDLGGTPRAVAAVRQS